MNQKAWKKIIGKAQSIENEETADENAITQMFKDR